MHKVPATQTLANLKTLFDFENDECIRKLTAQTAGYHGAHNANIVPPSPGMAATATPAPAPPHVDLGNGMIMFYCWSHGLSKNRRHTGVTSEHPKDGQKTNATAVKMQGGNNTISPGFCAQKLRPCP